MNQALNLVVSDAGKGMNRSNEKTIGIADPPTRRTMLQQDIDQPHPQLSRAKMIRTRMFHV